MAFEITVPNVTFKTRREIDEAPGFEWYDLSSEEIFAGKRVVMFALPGAFTPTCSSTHLPGYEQEYDSLKENKIDEVYCLSVNDSFVMNAWFSSLGIQNVKPIADGNGNFTRHMGMLVKKEAVDFGYRSQRYSMVVDNGRVEMIFVEDGKEDNFAGDPFDISDAESMLNYLTAARDVRREEIERAANQEDAQDSTDS